MPDYYDEFCPPSKIDYYVYENAIEDKDREISDLQDEIYEKDKRIEELENELDELKNAKNF